VLMADERGAVLLTNPAANQLLGFVDASPVSLSHALKNTKISPSLDRLTAVSDEPLAFEIVREKPKKLALAGTAVSFQFDQIGSRRSSIVHFLVFRDVTEERQEEILKRSF